jgi:hypothetical protein
MTVNQMIKKGLLIEEGMNYRTNDGRLIIREYQGSKLVWRIEGKNYQYRNLFEAYEELEY